MSVPRWIDISGGKPIHDAIVELFAITSATEYAVSRADFIEAGWKGEAVHLPIPGGYPGGYVTVHADRLCPLGAVWAVPGTSEPDRFRDEVQKFKAALIDWIDAAIERGRA